jgi:hypothetical protein
MSDYWKRQDGQRTIRIGASEFTDFPPVLGNVPPQDLRSGKEYDGSRIVHTLNDKRMKKLKQRRGREKRRKKAAEDRPQVPQA